MPKIWNGLDWISEPTYGVKNDTKFYSDCKLFSFEMLCLVFFQYAVANNIQYVNHISRGKGPWEVPANIKSQVRMCLNDRDKKWEHQFLTVFPKFSFTTLFCFHFVLCRTLCIRYTLSLFDSNTFSNNSQDKFVCTFISIVSQTYLPRQGTNYLLRQENIFLEAANMCVVKIFLCCVLAFSPLSVYEIFLETVCTQAIS